MNSLFYLSSVESTNDVVSQLSQPDLNGISAVYTFDQTKGRGQYGNTWEIQKNKNVAYSFILEANRIRLPFSLFNFYTALLLRDFIAKITENDVKVKWPNDIILQNKKIAGLLIEKKRVKNSNFYIIGLGINILQEDFGGLSKAGSIKSQTQLSPDLHTFAQELHDHLCEHIFLPPEEEELLKLYNEHLFRREKISVFEIHNIRQNGIISHADREGFLHVELESGFEKFFHKEINLLY
ncbi:biotin--[acetyl-CoA-carboxylase] ligase [Elizabethkingia argentiflava]|uniref:Biotin--[acetyl-CoA-carboxylase] ligase n=1 Tax=Elizabethkingia argenteiflava TaxID=2681556 RepID=A0A845PV16_9FLAO|nr:biotin--[acetyl-CoA-carboxylase] ligase [Elizabethkingia argenteiflava]NAW51674.1 biotin--[acetyl-CoA-carboxylase] ligase [Elizabethkingia argenteiflava]